MARHHQPRSGSLAFMPRKRAKKQTPSIRSWPKSDEANLLGFAGYKAGMTHLIATDNNKNSPSSGLDVQVPVTVLETPPMFVLGLRAYAKGYWGRETMTDIWASEIPKEILKKLKLSKGENPGKKLDELSKNEKLIDVTVIVATQPTLASLPKKKPDVMEMAIGGQLSDKIEYAKQILGKTVSIKDVFEENSNTDVCAITKGKGFQGIVKRWGVRIMTRKATKGRRHSGTGGAWTPARKLWTEPQPGQMGYHRRTEYNKQIIIIGEDGSLITPKGGFLKYGLVKGDFIAVSGSVPGPCKRLVRINIPKRESTPLELDVKYVSQESKQGV